MKRKLYVLLLTICLLGVSPNARADIIIENAASDWEFALLAPDTFPDIPSRIIVQYATSSFSNPLIHPSELVLSSESVTPRIITEYATAIHNETIIYPAALISATDNLPDRVVVEYATSIASNELVPFDITYLDVSFPVGGEVLNKGQKYYITWDSANVTGNIQIDLYMDGTNVLQLAAAAPNTGEYEFFVPDFLLGGTNYQIGISAENGQVWNFSATEFTITPFRCTVQSDISDAEMTTGDSITYRICIENPEDTELGNIEIINPIPAGTAFGSATGSFSYLEAEQEVRWNIGALAPGAIFCVELTVDVTASTGALVSNSVSVNSGAYNAILPAYHTDVTSNSIFDLGLTTGDVSLSTIPAVLEDFGVLELRGAVAFDPELPTYVISHGWKNVLLPPYGDYDLPEWQTSMADQIRILPANVFTWNWQLEAEGVLPPFLSVKQSAFNLYVQLEQQVLSNAPSYQGDIHLIGHSLGSGVAVYTAKYFRDFNSVLYDNLTNLTLLDSPYPITPGETFLADTKSQLFVDNYASMLGRRRYADADVNVELFYMDLLCWGNFNEAHGFSHEWYSSSVKNFQNPPALCDSDFPSAQIQYGFYWSTNRNVTDTLYFHMPFTSNWLLYSMQDPINYVQGFIQDTADWVHGQYVDSQGYIIDKKEELVDAAEKLKSKIQVLTALTFETAESVAGAVSDVTDHSSWIEYTVANIPYHLLRLIHLSDASVSMGIDIPEEANSLRFSFELPLADKGSVMEVFINDVPAMIIRCDNYVQKGWQQSEWIEISEYAGQHADLVFRLSNAGSDTKGVVHLDDIVVAKIIPSIDTDEDTVLDDEDNCPEAPNGNQLDTDSDGIGDVCDICPAAPDPDQIDRDCDCDVDGADLAELTAASDMFSKIDAIASAFGREACP